MADPKKSLQEAVRIQKDMIKAIRDAAEAARIEREKAAKTSG